jgi:hypothetical protein
MTLSEVAFGVSCFALGFALATVMWLLTFHKWEQRRLQDRYRAMVDDHLGLGQGFSPKIWTPEQFSEEASVSASGCIGGGLKERPVKITTGT